MPGYNPHEIEPKWQAYWEKHKTFRTEEFSDKPKFYVLDMFPYPSGAGLHVGHPEGYTATDIVARYKRMKGFNVLHPMGWDAFGLPAEQHAIKTGTHPRENTLANIANFRRQLKMLGFSYDWDREIDTTDPTYYKWTQWIFLQLYKKGLAYIADVPVNWCPELGTVLANEEVIDGKSVIGDHPVVRKPMKQWMLKITAYADRLLEDLDGLDWPESIKAMQREWIGRSIGAEIDFAVKDAKPAANLRVFTTRPDTLFGATFMVVAPEHPLVPTITTSAHKAEVEAYREASKRKSELDRTGLAKTKTGANTGAFAINPATRKPIPIWIADYVLMSYGTGAIMCVPGHDQRDYEFAKTFNLEIKEVISGGDLSKAAWEGDGTLVNSDFLNGLSTTEAKKKMTEWVEQQKLGKKTVNYKLRDWLFSRQRYWGEPFPIIYDEQGNPQPLPEEMLPITLPEVKTYQPSGTGESPLATIKEWVNTVNPKTKKPAKRETNTMPQWAGSCWYYLRFIDPKNPAAAWDKKKEKYWMPVDLYIGGAEHAVAHLLYARFWHKVLFDLGHVSTNEPFKKLFNQGMISGFTYRTADGKIVPIDDIEKRGDKTYKRGTDIELSVSVEKMSKSLGNVVNPDDVVKEFGADTLRLYEMFMGPLEASKPWDPDGVTGCFRFLQRVYRLVIDDRTDKLNATLKGDAEPDAETRRVLHATIKKVSEDIENLRFNTAIAQMMTLLNHLQKLPALPKPAIESFVKLLAPFAPHLAEELWERLGHGVTLAVETWPTWDEAYLKLDTLEIPVQINGKVKAKLTLSADVAAADVEAAARSHPKVIEAIAGKTIKKIVIAPGNKLVSVVIG